MNSPESVLPGGAERQLRGGRGVLVDTGEGKVDEDPADLPRSDVIPLQPGKSLQRELTTVGTLKIRHLINRHRCPGRALAASFQWRGCSSTLGNEGNELQSEGECCQGGHPECSEGSMHREPQYRGRRWPVRLDNNTVSPSTGTFQYHSAFGSLVSQARA